MTPDDTSPIPASRLRHLSIAVMHLGDSLSTRSDCPYDVSRKAGMAAMALSQFFTETEGAEFSAEEAECSSSLHTWLRKCDDSNLGCAIYALWDRGIGRLPWLALIRSLMKDDPIEETSIIKPEMHTKDDWIMWHLILAYQEVDDGWVNAQEFLKENL